MKKFLLMVGLALVLAYSLALILTFDPDEQRPGTRLTGNLADTPDFEWDLLGEGRNIHLQMNTWYGVPHSITVRAMPHGGELFIPCGRCADKWWPSLVASDNAVLVRVGDTLYPGTLERVTEPMQKHRVFGMGDHGRLANVWLYRFQPSG